MYSGSKKAKSLFVLASVLVTSGASTLLSTAAGPSSDTYQDTMTVGCSQECDVDTEQKTIDDERSVIDEEQRQLYVELASLMEKQKQLDDQELAIQTAIAKKGNSFQQYNEEQLKILKKRIARAQRELDALSAIQKAKQAKVTTQLLAIDLRQMKLNLNRSLPMLTKTQWEDEINGVYSPDALMSIMPLLSAMDVSMINAKNDMEVSIKHLTDLYFRNIKSASIIEENGKGSPEYYKDNALKILSTIKEIHDQYYLQALQVGVSVSNLQKDIFEIILGSDKDCKLEDEVQKLMDMAKEKRQMSRAKSKNEVSAEMNSIDSEN